MNGKENIIFYGRARRIAIAKVVGGTVAVILLLVLVFSIIFREREISEKNVNYSYLSTYFVNNGYTCEALYNDGGKCYIVNDNSRYMFYRYDDGFRYTIKTEGYSLDIMHRLSEEDIIEFKTTSKAFVGVTNQTFRCVYDNNVLDSIESCSSTEKVKLEVKSYLSVIKMAQADLNNAIEASGYSKDDLLINYEWNKK